MQFDAPILFTILTASIDLLLGVIIFAQNPRNHTNIAYALFSLAVACWGFGVGFFLSVSDPKVLDFLARFLYFAGGSIPATFLYFSSVFVAKPDIRKLIIFIPTFLFIPLYFASNFVIAGYTISTDGTKEFLYGPLHYLFDIHLWTGFVIALVILIRTYSRLSGETRQHVLYIMFGTYAVLAVAGVTNVIGPLIAIFDLIWIGPTATVVWVWVVAYAVIRHQLFDIRVIAAELFVIALCLLLFLQAFFSASTYELLINIAIFVASFVLGSFLIRSVRKEIRQRVLIEHQEKELETANREQENLLRFISHEVKGYLTKSEAGFSAITDGTFGPISADLKNMTSTALNEMRKGVATVMDILSASDLKKGTVSYKKQTFDFKAAVLNIVEELKPAVTEKKLSIDLSIGEGRYSVVGDEEKLRTHAIRNLIDNAIKYTPSGTIRIQLSDDDKVRFSVQDSGVGITPEDMERLFTEGGHGKDSVKINVHSTGYGLYIAKNIIEAHGGKIWAESEGEGKGARFIVELPVA